MASKQLGKLRQWAGEVISSQNKTTVSEEFAELEKDVELRREGALKLLAASGVYQHVLSKKKKTDAFADAEKLLPIDTLGIVMILHGEEFGEDSAYGTSLVKLGRAHCKVATLQEGYALTFKDTFVASIETFTNEIKGYDAERKKLDSRRLAYDAALAKYEKVKGGKKEKEKKEAEEEMEKAKERYEETSEEVQTIMHAIQDNEVVQLRELSAFLELEINFVEQYLNVLKDAKEDWLSEPTKGHAAGPRVNRSPHRSPHNFKRSESAQAKRSQASISKGSTDSSEEEAQSASRSRRSSLNLSKRRDSNKISSRPSSRSASRKRSDSRSDSVSTIGDKPDKEKDKEKEKERDKSRRMSVADWASSAVGWNKKGKEKFSSLNDDEKNEDDDPEDEKLSPVTKFQSITRKLSRDKSQNGSPKTSAKILKPPSLQDRKIATALYSFRGSNDELTFEVGDEITVVNEVLDGWWMGELNGKKGLFPTTHVEVSILRAAGLRKANSKDFASLTYDNDRRGLADDNSSYESSDQEDAHDLARQPLSPNHHPSPFYGGMAADAMSVTSSLAEDEEYKPISRSLPLITSNLRRRDADDDAFLSASFDKSSLRSRERSAPPVPTRPTAAVATSDVSSPPRKAPPPPPPRRATVTALPTPPIPARPRRPMASNITTPASSVSSIGYDQSPFESLADLRTAKGCGSFRQNPFQAKGMCSNCQQFHG